MVTTQQAKLHVVNAGDSLSLLAAEAYGSVSNFREIADENGIDIFEQLPIGQAINLPSLETVQAKVKAAQERITGLIDQADNLLDLSGIKSPGTGEGLAHQLINWIL